MKNCPKCEKQLIQGIRYCLNCGLDVEAKDVKKTVKKDVKKCEKDVKKCKSKSRLDTRLFEII